jgi:uncharacterized protein with PQ loop repeat
MSSCSSFSGFESFGCWMGNFSALVYFIAQVPQIILNFRRKTTKGLSPNFVVIRLFGLSFFTVNAIIQSSAASLIALGALLTFAYIILLVQYCYYEYNPCYYGFLTFIIIPIFVSLVFPSTIPVTNYINSISQVACYIPFISECIHLETTKGISLFGQHIKFLGSVMGLFMCATTCGCDTPGWLMHIISMGQACITYIVAIHYNEMRFFDSPLKATKQIGMSDLDQILQKGKEDQLFLDI